MKKLILLLVILLIMFLFCIVVVLDAEPFLYCDPTPIKNDYYQVSVDNNHYYPKPKHLASSNTYRLQLDMQDIPFDNNSIIKARGFKGVFYTKWIYLIKPEELEGLRVK